MKAVVKRIHHVQLCIPVGPEDVARKFYTGVLGFKEIEKPEALRMNGSLWYDLGGAELHIGVERMDQERSKRHPVFEIEDIRRLRDALERSGVTTHDEQPIPDVV